MGRIFQLVCLAGLFLILNACTTIKHVPLQKADTELAETELLDLWIEFFDPGSLPEKESKLLGLTMDIRNAEAYYIPIHLRGVIEKSGYWGAVRVVPETTPGGDVRVKGEILNSDARSLELLILAFDATGIKWLEKTYHAKREIEDYQATEKTDQEVFEDLYHAIANDLIQHRQKFDSTEVTNIRRVAGLKFAVDMSEQAFKPYLEHDDKTNRYKVLRLPAQNDPAFERVLSIRERDFLLVDTLNGHYDNYYRKMRTPYNQWRTERMAELQALANVKRSSLAYQVAGVLAIITAAVAGESIDNRALSDILVLGGAYSIQKGISLWSESAIHKDAIEEMGVSFSQDSRPLLIEVDGDTHELTGTAKIQYEKWRELLQQMYINETYIDPDISIEFAAEPDTIKTDAQPVENDAVKDPGPRI